MANAEELIDDNIKSNITQLLNSFMKFHMLITDTGWVQTATVEEIKTAFKLGNFIEKSSKHLTSINALQEFVSLLKTHSNNEIMSDINYLYACDYVLKLFFRSENISETTMDVTVRIYSSLFPQARFQQVLSELITLSGTLESLADFMNFLPNDRIREFQHHLNLSTWEHLRQMEKDSIEADIQERLSVNNLDNNLNDFLGMLTVKNASGTCQIIQKLILQAILEKMQDRSILGKHFWCTLFKKINVDVLCKVCECSKEFQNSLFSFIIYLGSMMDKDGDIWISDPTKSLYSTIGFYDLLILIKSVKKIDTEFVIRILNEARNETGSGIWDDLKLEIMSL